MSMTDYGMTAAQRQYDSQEPPKYNDEPVGSCDLCGHELYEGEECYTDDYHHLCCGCYSDFYKWTVNREEYKESE